MNVRVCVGVAIVGWFLTSSGAIASPPPGYSSNPVLSAPAVEPAPADRTEVVDGQTGARLRLTARPNGALQVHLAWPDFDFRKIIQPNGDFTLRLAGYEDVAVLVRTGDRLRVTRNGKTAALRLAQADEPGLEQVQHVLAGSRAMRMFRALHSRLADDTLATVQGIVIDVTDVLVGVLQGDEGVLERRRPKAAGRISRTAFGGREPCYDEWEQEVTVAWVVHGDCIMENAWYPGGPSLCAIAWTIKIEGLWFKYLRCVSFPWKVE